MRADGSSSIGMGHVVRSLVLARELMDLGAEVEVWGSSVGVCKALADSFRIVRVRELTRPSGGRKNAEEVLRFEPDLVIVDGYHFEESFFDVLERAEIDYGVIDDNRETKARNPVFVLNQNPSASAELYSSRFPLAALFLGLNWALIRKEFAVVRDLEPRTDFAAYLSLGGSDVRGLTHPIARCISSEKLSLAVGVGPAVRNRKALVARLAELPGVHVIESASVPLAMAKSRLLMLGAGSALWEANALGKPTIGLIVADNQVSPSKFAEEQGLVSRNFDFRKTQELESICNRLLDAVSESSIYSPPKYKVNLYGAHDFARSILGSRR